MQDTEQGTKMELKDTADALCCGHEGKGCGHEELDRPHPSHDHAHHHSHPYAHAHGSLEEGECGGCCSCFHSHSNPFEEEGEDDADPLDLVILLLGFLILITGFFISDSFSPLLGMGPIGGAPVAAQSKQDAE